MILEELRFAFQRVAHAFFGVDVLLTAVDDADKAQLQWIYTPSEDIQRVCTGIHKVKFCEYTNCALPLWIDGTGEFERFRVGQVYICRRYSQDDTLKNVYSKRTSEEENNQPVGF